MVYRVSDERIEFLQAGTTIEPHDLFEGPRHAQLDIRRDARCGLEVTWQPR